MRNDKRIADIMPDLNKRTTTRRLSSLYQGVLLFLLIWGCKLWLVDSFGSDIPYWDQWDAEGLHVYQPYFRHELTAEAFLRPHNEHRVVFTKLINLALLAAGGQWDARVQCVFNAALHSLLGAALFFFMKRQVGEKWNPVLLVLAIAVFAAPVSWQNVLSGFHSQQYLLIAFSLGAMTGLLLTRAGSPWWWTGAAVALAADFTMASGIFASLSVAGVVFASALAKRMSWRSAWPTLAVCAVAVAVGAASRVHVDGHDWMKASTFHDFYQTFVRCLQWPNTGFAWNVREKTALWAALVIYAPSLILLVRHFARKDAPAIERCLLAICAWVVAQAAATAYVRSVQGMWPASRYLDSLAVGVLLNGFVITYLSDKTRRLAGRLALLALGIAWVALVGTGLNTQTRKLLQHEFPENRNELAAYEDNVRQYLLHDDIAFLQGKKIPYPDPYALVSRLSAPGIKDALPSSVRAPLTVTYRDEQNAGGSAVVGIRNSPSSESPDVQSFAASEGRVFRSSDFKPHLTGYVGIRSQIGPEDEVELAIHDSSSGKVIDGPRRLSPGFAGFTWLKSDSGSCYLTIKSVHSKDGFRISDPVEASRTSLAALALAHAGKSIAWIAGVLLFFAVVCQIVLDWKSEQAPQPARA